MKVWLTLIVFIILFQCEPDLAIEKVSKGSAYVFSDPRGGFSILCPNRKYFNLRELRGKSASVFTIGRWLRQKNELKVAFDKICLFNHSKEGCGKGKGQFFTVKAHWSSLDITRPPQEINSIHFSVCQKVDLIDTKKLSKTMKNELFFRAKSNQR